MSPVKYFRPSKEQRIQKLKSFHRPVYSLFPAINFTARSLQRTMNKNLFNVLITSSKPFQNLYNTSVRADRETIRQLLLPRIIVLVAFKRKMQGMPFLGCRKIFIFNAIPSCLVLMPKYFRPMCDKRPVQTSYAQPSSKETEGYSLIGSLAIHGPKKSFPIIELKCFFPSICKMTIR